MQPAPDIILRDIHQLPPPPLWPPAPGWWIVAALFGLAALAGWLWLARRRRYRRSVARMFDEAVAAASDPQAEVAAISALLRRAARRHRADADVLDGQAWLTALDEGAKTPLFQAGTGRLLIEGVYRPNVEPADVEQLRTAARQRFLEWMAAK